MGHKVNPIGLRIGITQTWKSKWFGKKEYKDSLREDIGIRGEITSKWKNALISDVEIERSQSSVKIVIRTARPGVLIGRGGSGVEDIKHHVQEKFFRGRKVNLRIDVQEVRNMEESAMILAQSAAEQIEKRMPFRRILKSTIEQAMKSNMIKGAKMELSGRLGGAEMSRREWLSKGTLPLHTLRANIDFARVTARTTYGAIGIKVWLYKGEVFDKAKN